MVFETASIKSELALLFIDAAVSVKQTFLDIHLIDLVRLFA